MRPSSSPSERGLFDSVLSAGGAWDATTDEAWLRAMLRAEAALALVLARHGLVPRESAAAIARCADEIKLDVGDVGAAAAAGGNPVIPLVEAIRAAVGHDHAPHVHAGATSQDILDSATMVITAGALDAILGDLAGATERLAALARLHRTTPMIERTLLQQALPTTFGLKAAGWLAAVDAAALALEAVRRDGLAAQLGGPVGTLAAYGAGGLSVLHDFAEQLGLAAPAAPWHTDRTRIGHLAGALGVLSGACGKVATDLVLLAQTEVGEVREERSGHGGSSSMAHKANAISVVSARAAAIQAPGQVATLLSAMAHEHGRAAGAWHAEWRPLRELLRITGSAVWWLGDALDVLVVDSDRMAANLAGSGLDGSGIGLAGELVDVHLAEHERWATP